VKKFLIALILLTHSVWAQDIQTVDVLTSWERMLIGWQKPVEDRLSSESNQWKAQEYFNEISRPPLSPLENNPESDGRIKRILRESGRVFGRGLNQNIREFRKIFEEEGGEHSALAPDGESEQSYDRFLGEASEFRFRSSFSTSRARFDMNGGWLDFSSEYRPDGGSRLTTGKDILSGHGNPVSLDFTRYLEQEMNEVSLSRRLIPDVRAGYRMRDYNDRSFGESIVEFSFFKSF
jgi:hypothetical protein